MEKDKFDPSKIKNPYTKLGLRDKADESEIRKAYRSLALIHHPDKNRDADLDKFIEIKNAYELLIETRTKQRIDEYLESRVNLNKNLLERDKRRKAFAEKLFKNERRRKEDEHKKPAYTFYNFDRKDVDDEYSALKVNQLRQSEKRKMDELKQRLSSLIVEGVWDYMDEGLLKNFFKGFGKVKQIEYTKEQSLIVYVDMKSAEKAYDYLKELGNQVKGRLLEETNRESKKASITENRIYKQHVDSAKLFELSKNVNGLNI